MGIIFKSPSQHFKSRCIRLNFPLSNNQAENEALIIGLQWAEEVNIYYLEAYSDSQVVVGQINDEYIVNSDNLKEYALLAKKLAAKFKYFLLKKINQNTDADKLVKITSGEIQEEDPVEIEVYTSLSLALQISAIDMAHGTCIDAITQHIVLGTLPENLVKSR